MTARPPSIATRFRPDIEGLRAIAVTLVLLYHAGVPWMEGGFVGVDVFFVVSGYLISGLIVRERMETGHFSFGRFYARRARRLLPAIAVTLSATGLMTWFLLPANRWSAIAGDIVASSAYVMNWRLAGRSVDYLAADDALSPLQHFWSLAVEEQFYVLWPVMLIAVIALAQRRSRRVRAWLPAVIAAIAMLSFAWNAFYTSTSPAQAYFVTTTRVWELALGGLLAVVAPSLSIASWLRSLLSLLGVSAILISATIYSANTVFPGVAALVPTVGCLAVIAAGITTDPMPLVNRCISVRPFQFVGGLSYSLYLWHWPIVVVATYLWQPLTASEGLAVVAASFLPAWLAKRVIEDPIRHNPSVIRSGGKAFGFGLACTGVGLVAGVMLGMVVPSGSPEQTPEIGRLDARPIANGEVQVGTMPPIESMIPHPASARDDTVWGDRQDECHQNQTSPEVLTCVHTNEEADYSIALVGDSHAAQWLPALRQVALRRGWKLTNVTKSACLFGDVLVLDGSGQEYESCREWTRNAVDLLTDDATAPDLILTSNSHGYTVVEEGRRLENDENVSAIADGLAETWARLERAGLSVVVLRDTPRPRLDIPECVLSHHPDPEPCTVPLDIAEKGNQAQLVALDKVDVPLVDLTNYICPERLCTPVLGNVLVWRDTNHLSATFVEVLSRELERALIDAMES